MDQLQRLNLPPFEPRLRRDSDSRRGGLEIYDSTRRRWVALTPEEWVRQNFVNYLVGSLDYPSGLVGNEISLRLNGLSRRCDSVVYTRGLRPLVIVEYKAPSVAVTQKVFDQIARYNIVMEAPYLIVSNGLAHYCCRFVGEGYAFLDHIPRYGAIEGDIFQKK